MVTNSARNEVIMGVDKANDKTKTPNISLTHCTQYDSPKRTKFELLTEANLYLTAIFDSPDHPFAS